jgi:hypothetical protein
MALQEPIFANVRGPPSGKGLRVTLWAVQLLLALMFGMTGLMNLSQPIAVLARMLGWPGSVPAGLVRLVGLAELAAAIGLVFPALTRIKPALTSWAAGGLAALMYMAVLFHLASGEAGALPLTLVVGGLSGFVVWGRTWKAPISPRG